MPKNKQTQSKFKMWRSYFGEKAHQLLLLPWQLLVAYSVVILIFTGVYNILSWIYSHGEVLPTETSGGFGDMLVIIALAATGALVLLAYIALFILSLFPKGRKIADKILKPADSTRLALLEKKVKKIEGGLTSLEKRVEKVEDNLKKVEDGITSINTKLGNIETTLKEMVTKRSNHSKRQTSQKSRRGKTKRVKK